MKSGKMRRRVTIRRQGAPVDDGVTTLPGAWATLATRYAQDIRSRGREVFENLGTEAEIPMTFLLRFDSVTKTIKTTDRIGFEGKEYDLKSVQEIGFRDGIECVGVASDES